MHGPGEGRTSFGGIRSSALKKAAVPANGGDETVFLNAFLDARKAAMRSEQGHTDTSRVDTMQRKFLREGNMNLEPPLRFAVYGDSFVIDKVRNK
jgi:chitosanase